MSDKKGFDEFEEGQEELEVGFKVVPSGSSDRTIEKHFSSGRLRVIQDKNDFFLPHVVDFIEGRSWGNLRPEYQRRLRWDTSKKSRLIESFIMNVPVPPVFLFESEIGRFEVMDGQQRLNAIVDFFQNRFKLSGLRIWPSLNGRNFSELPPLIRKGLERAKVSAITLMSDAAESEANALDLRAQVFERLNTGGERLNPQELRNSLYSGEFNKVLISMSGEKLFTDAWGIPEHDKNILSDGSPTADLLNNNLYKRMSDVEIVLRFFAFVDEDKISGSVRKMLDNAMKDNVGLSEDEARTEGDRFKEALTLCVKVLGDLAFCLPESSGKNSKKHSKPLYDAQMVGFYSLREAKEDILRNKENVKNAVVNLALPDSDNYDLMVGRANTADAIRSRISTVRAAILGAL